MKNVNDGRTIATPIGRGRHTASESVKETLETDVVVSASFAAIIALAIAMGAGLYSWSRHAPVFLHSRAAVPATVETIPWQS
jgi:hypothetical protein